MHLSVHHFKWSSISISPNTQTSAPASFALLSLASKFSAYFSPDVFIRVIGIFISLDIRSNKGCGIP